MDHCHHAGPDDASHHRAGHADATHGHAGHAGHDHCGHAGMFRRRFFASLALTVPVVVTSPMVMDWFGYDLDLPWLGWVGPVLGTGLNWQLYSGPGFTAAVDIPRDAWFHVRLEVGGAQARLFVRDMAAPALVMSDLKSGLREGQLALWVLTGATYVSNFEVRKTPDAPWRRNEPRASASGRRPSAP